jgi:hypothetical protein
MLLDAAPAADQGADAVGLKHADELAQQVAFCQAGSWPA